MTHWPSRLLAAELGCRMCEGRRQGVAEVKAAPLAQREPNVLHRPADAGQGPRRRGPVPQLPRQGGGAVCGPKTADPGAGTGHPGAPRHRWCAACPAEAGPPALPALRRHTAAFRSSPPAWTARSAKRSRWCPHHRGPTGTMRARCTRPAGSTGSASTGQDLKIARRTSFLVVLGRMTAVGAAVLRPVTWHASAVSPGNGCGRCRALVIAVREPVGCGRAGPRLAAGVARR